MDQTILRPDDNYAAVDRWIEDTGSGSVLLVSDSSLPFLKISAYFDALEKRPGLKLVRFSDFQPNPLYESVVKGVALLRREKCGAVIAVGGGSAMDVAKCIRLYAGMEGSGEDGSFLKEKPVILDIPFLAMPTTAGTGSEATRYAVIYYREQKQSVTDISCIPKTILLDESTLFTLPLYQKKSTMLDALCHAIEACWSVNSTEESRAYSTEAIRAIMENKDGYFANDPGACCRMLLAANTAGKAINITQTTAGHAMCYKITSLFGTAHGHAAALAVRVLFPWMIENTARCTDPRGEDTLKAALLNISQALGCSTPEEGAEAFVTLFESLELPVPSATEEQFETLKKSVNPVRLKNHPMALDEETIDFLYHRILNAV